MSVDLLPNHAGPVQRAMAASYAERRARLFKSHTPVKVINIVRHVVEPVAAPVAPPAPDPVDLPYAPTSVRGVIDAVCKKHMIGRADLLSMSRRPNVVRCRQECCYELRHSGILINGEPISLPVIGRHLGGLDHTTVLYGIRKHAKLLEELSTLSTVVTGTGTEPD